MELAASIAAPGLHTSAADSEPRVRHGSAAPTWVVAPSSIVAVAVALMSFGVVMIASATFSPDRPLFDAHFWRTPAGRQVLFVVAGLVLTALSMRASIAALDRPHARRLATWIVFGLAVALLIATLIPGVADPHRGSHRWLKIGSVGLDVGFQPSELAKLAMVAMLAWLLADRNTNPRFFMKGFVPAAVVTGLCVGLVGKENLGTAVLLALVAGAMLVAGGCHALHLAMMGGLGVSGLTGLLFAATYRLDRITAFANIWADPRGKGYQPIQSLASIASGGWLGVGLGSGLQKFGYLPESHTDFIFAIVCEETGLLGGGLIIGLFCAFAWLGMRIMLSAVTPFERLLAFGLTMLVCLQAAINIAVVTVSMPTTGVPLPMISAGGSGLLIVSIEIGILAAIAERARRAAAVQPEGG